MCFRGVVETVYYLSFSRKNVDNSRREAGFLDELPQVEGGKGRLLSRFENESVTGSQCRSEFPGSHL
jgi:hypothetical protein